MLGKFECVRQQDQMDCGAAALATICKHYGCTVGIGKIRELVWTDKQGTTLLGLLKGAEQLGFDAKAAKGDWEGLLTCPLPLIAHYVTAEGYLHFVVVHKIDGNNVIVADPGKGVVKISKDEFCKRWTGYVLIATPANLKPQTNGVSKSQFLTCLIKPHLRIIAIAFLCAVLFTVLGLGTSVFVRHLVDNILVHARTKLLDMAAIAMILILVFKLAFNLIRSYVMLDLSRKFDLSLISCYMRHIVRLPMKFFETRQVGEILSRVNDATKIRNAISNGLITIVLDATMIVVISGAMFVSNKKLALISLAFLPVMAIFMLIMRKPLASKQRSAMEQAAALEARLVEDVSGVETIKSFGIEEHRIRKSEHSLVKFFKSLFSADMFGVSMDSFTLIAIGVATLALLWSGGHSVMSGTMTIGQLMFFYSLSGYLFGAIERSTGAIVSLQDASIALDRLWEILQLELEKKERKHVASFKHLEDAIRIRQVTFSYGYRGDAIKNVTMDIPKGYTVAVVGESGSGKSTICKLLSKFYEPAEGKIAVNGVDLRDIDTDDWRAKVGYVSQDAHIFNGTIAENISVGKPEASLDEIMRAAELAGLAEFIDSLPQRYETLIGERGANLSGGQRQRIAIARAILRDPDILIFDEATSHLDSRTEQKVLKTIRENLDGKTIIMIAHRLSTIMAADIIYVMDKGEIAECGVFDDLVSEPGIFQSMWAEQTGTTERVGQNEFSMAYAGADELPVIIIPDLNYGEPMVILPNLGSH